MSIEPACDPRGVRSDIPILIVDDDRDFAESLLDILELRGFSASVCHNVRAAADTVRSLRPAISMIDLRMPDGSGTDVLSDIRQVLPDCFCIMITAHADLSSAVSALEMGAFCYLQKPFSPAELFQHLERIVEMIRLREEKQRADFALTDSEERYRLLVESVNDCIYSHDLAGRFRSVNRAMASMLGVPAPQLVGRSMADFILLQPGGDFVASYLEPVLTEGRLNGIWQVEDRAGEVHHLEYHNVRVEKEGQQTYVSGVGRDITAAVRVRNEMKELERRLAQAQKMEAMGTLAGGIAHDFNNILAQILGYTELALLRIPGESNAVNDLKKVMAAGLRAKSLVEQILGFSRVQDRSKGPIPLRLVVKEALRMIRATLPATIRIVQRFTVPAGQDTVYSDPTQIHQLMINLCSNAAHAMRPDGGLLEVRVELLELDEALARQLGDLHPGRFVALSVRDTGRGMDEATRERIFDPYFTTKCVGDGTGLGLATVHGIVKGHNGAIEVLSEPGEGSTFRIYLPQVVQQSLTPILDTESLDSAPTGTGHILLVDDEGALVDLLEGVLTHLGYTVSPFTRAPDALAAFHADPSRFDLVVTDMTMPGMSGIDLARRLLAERPAMPILLCTGYSERISEKTAEEFGIREFLMKPVLRNALARAVKRAMTPSPTMEGETA